MYTVKFAKVAVVKPCESSRQHESSSQWERKCNPSLRVWTQSEDREREPDDDTSEIPRTFYNVHNNVATSVPSLGNLLWLIS